MIKRARKFHRITGILLCLPMLGWITTGCIFLIKPGYEGAYARLSTKLYPVTLPIAITPKPDWLSWKLVHTALGHHLLVEATEANMHLDPKNLQPVAFPNQEQLGQLINDATSIDPARYGKISSIIGNKIATSTNVTITIDWQTLSLSQSGNDTAWINRFYKIHYLQWTPYPTLNKLLGITGLTLLLLSLVFGARLLFRQSVKTQG